MIKNKKMSMSENSTSVINLEPLKWRYAVKMFDANRKLSDEQLNLLLESARLAPTAFGQQPFKIIVVNNPAVRQELLAHSYGQEKVALASHLLVFAADTALGDDSVDHYMENAARIWNTTTEALAGFADAVKGTYNALGEQGRISWAQHQAHIALGTLLTVAAYNNIDACPMTGFSADKYDEILGLKAKKLKSTVIVTLGYRSAEDSTQHMSKVRKPVAEFIEIV
jgi:nitroreductase